MRSFIFKCITYYFIININKNDNIFKIIYLAIKWYKNNIIGIKTNFRIGLRTKWDITEIANITPN